MLTQIKKLRDMVSQVLGRRLLALSAIFLLASIFDSTGLMLVFWLFQLIVDPAAAEGSRWFRIAGSAFGAGSMAVLATWLCGALLALFIVKTVTHILAIWLRARIEMRVRHRIATELIAGYLAIPYGLYLRRNPNELVRNIHAGAGTCSLNVVGIIDLASDTLLFGAVAGTLIYLQPMVASAILAGFGILSSAYFAVGRRRFQNWGEIANTAAEGMYRTAIEALGGVKQIKVLGAEFFFTHLFSGCAERFGLASLKNVLVQQSLKPVLELLIVLALVVPVGILLLQGLSAASIIPLLAAFGLAAYRLMPSVIRVAAVLQNLRFGGPAVDAVHADIMTFRNAHWSARPRPTLRLESEIRLDSVSLRYEGRDRDTLSDITLAIHRGESVALIGASGSGKTTLVDVLLGLLSPDAGTVTVDGVVISKSGQPEPTLFGYVPQDAFLVDDSIRRNIALGAGEASIDEARVHAAVAAASLTDLVATLPAGLETPVGDRGVRLSGGQRQRIAIARALYHDPDVLVLDEATSSLDAVTEREIADTLHRLRGRKTLIIIAHRLSTVKNCDRLVFLEGGRLVDTGTFSELYERSENFRTMAQNLGVEAPRPPETALA